MNAQNVANPNNTYDDVGKEHNKILEKLVKINNVSEAKIMNQGDNQLNAIPTSTDEERAFVDKLIGDLPDVYNLSQQPLSQILNPIVTTNAGRTAVTTLEGIVSRQNTPTATFIADIKQFEDNDIINNRDLSSQEKVAILTCTSVARFSVSFWDDFLNVPKASPGNADIGAAGGASLAAAAVSFFFGPVAPAAYLVGVGVSAGVASGLAWLKG